jgi:CO/xanthine dehydrogenase FAD-binding subunit
MKPPAFNYIAANTVDEALSVLSSQGDRAKIFSWGTEFNSHVELQARASRGAS